jgi:hypothetical protein
LLTTSKSFESAPATAMAWATLSDVPTGTVDFDATTVYSSMTWPISFATCSTMLMSAEPSSADGVPTAIITTGALSVRSPLLR